MSGFMYNPKGNVWDKVLVPKNHRAIYLDLSILEDIIKLFERLQIREIREQDSYNQNNTINIQIFIDNLKPSARGELEISDVNNMYIKQSQINYDIIEGWWTDAGVFESLLRASNLIANKVQSSEVLKF